jgi:carboxylesterase type B
MASSSKQQLPTPVVLRHGGLNTTFNGVEHPLSTSATPIAQFRGIPYATISTRFRLPALVSTYPDVVDASRHGCVVFVVSSLWVSIHRCSSPVCPQPETQYASLSCDGDVPTPAEPLEQNELDCLNLTVTCPRSTSSGTRHPVMVWIHGYVLTVRSTSSRKLTHL